MIQSLTTGLAGSALLPFSGFSPLSQANDPSSGSEKKHKKLLIIDTDPGVDDALAILASLVAEEAEVLMFTTVFGNGPIENTTANTRFLLDHFGKSIPVHQGCSRAILSRNTFEGGKRIHGEYYLGQLKPPEPFFQPQPNTAAHEMARAIIDHPHEVAVLAIGPLTNIALAIILYPEICGLVKQIVAMGGAVNVPGNNYNKTAECNTFADPHAAMAVLSSGAPIVLAPLNATRKAILIESQVQRFLDSNSNASFKAFFQNLLAGYLKMHDRYAGEKSCVLHDPLALEVLLSEGLGRREKMEVLVELNGPERLGATLGEPSSDGNVEVVADFEYDAFMGRFFERMEKLPEVFQPK